MSALRELTALEDKGEFARRHIGPSDSEIAAMLQVVGAESLQALTARTVPAAIRSVAALPLPPAVTEAEVIAELRGLASKNRADIKSLIGMGYHGTLTPPVILRNIFENPGWYTAYTPRLLYTSDAADE